MEPLYTIADREAQAEARGISYGKLMAYVANGMELPKLKRSVKWPPKSAHLGEEQLDSLGNMITIPQPEPTIQPKAQKLKYNDKAGAALRKIPCSRCGERPLKSEIDFVYRRDGRAPTHKKGSPFSHLCRACGDLLLPERVPSEIRNANKELRADAKAAGCRTYTVTRCIVCNRPADKRQSWAYYVKRGKKCPLVRGYVCQECDIDFHKKINPAAK